MDALEKDLNNCWDKAWVQAVLLMILEIMGIDKFLFGDLSEKS